MGEKYIFIINPKAGKNSLSMSYITKIEATAKTLELDYEIYITKSVGDAKRFVFERCQNLECPTRFYACGGDGTINEVINGAALSPLARVGILPLGSGNDYIKSFKGYSAEDFLNIPAQIEGKPIDIDLIKVGDRYVANMVNIGFDATVAHNFVKFKTKPGVSGKNAYTISVFYSLVSKISRPMKITLDDGTEIFDDMLLCSIAKGIYCGGQYRTSPRADISDGFIDVCPIKKISRFQFLSFFDIYKAGNHITVPKLKKYVSYHKCKKATIECRDRLPVCFDGEPSFLEEKTTFEVVPSAVKIILPMRADKADIEDRRLAAEVL